VSGRSGPAAPHGTRLTDAMPEPTHEERTQVAIVGAGPAGMLLAHLLAAEGVESVVVETRSEEYVAARIRAGILEQSTVDLLRSVGLADRLQREGDEHRGIHLQWHDGGSSERHHLDFVDLTGRSVWVYGQTEVQKDLVAAARDRGQPVHYEVADTALHDLETDEPSVTFTTSEGSAMRLRADVLVGCDGSFGPSRAAVPSLQTWERTYPYSWLGVLADVAPSTDELIYAWHPDGFALHSMRSSSVSRFYLQVPNDTSLDDWSDDRIWDGLSTRFALDGWALETGPITDRSVLPMRSHVSTPMRHGRLFLAGDAAHIVPPTGAKGLNLAVADVALLAPALVAWLRSGDATAADAYADAAVRRVWRCTHFSWWMTTMLHATGDPFDEQLQLSQLRWVTSSEAGAAGLAENYAGLPIGF
jgi:p-hydroxybenzoate 3-monooxygenase